MNVPLGETPPTLGTDLPSGSMDAALLGRSACEEPPGATWSGGLLRCGQAGSTWRRMTVFFRPFARSKVKPASSYIGRVPL